ncbi:MAG: hypothetical protein R3288_05315 [Woeseiaceae bacterium]|nr:hypothetical protein [Woeseiaceae bacterium]
MGDSEVANGAPDRWTLIRDAAVFQVKLIVDGFRDLVLVPTSFVAALISLFSGRDGKPGPHFYRLLGLGKQSERWIDLFAAYRHSPWSERPDRADEDRSIDDLVRRVESFVVDEYRRGGVTAQAKSRIDRALRAIRGVPDDTA